MRAALLAASIALLTSGCASIFTEQVYPVHVTSAPSGASIQITDEDGDVVIMALMGGSGTLIGPVLGAVVFESLKELLSELTGRWHGIMGVLFIIFVILLPDGLAGLFRRLWLRVKRSP